MAAEIVANWSSLAEFFCLRIVRTVEAGATQPRPVEINKTMMTIEASELAAAVGPQS